MRVETHHTADELAALIRAEARGKVARRLTAVRMALLGHTAADSGTHALLSERQVRTWVARYNAGGPDGLADAPGRGRKPALDPETAGRLGDRLRAGPTPADGVCTLRGADVRRILREEFGVLRSLAATYDILHALGFEPLRPRPRHPDADPDAQEAFKKSSRRSSPRFGRPVPMTASRSGSRTRHGSASRAR